MTDDPRGPADGDDLEPTPISPEDEAAVSELLAALPDPQLPADVQQRILASVGAVDLTAPAHEPGAAALDASSFSEPLAPRHAAGSPSGRPRRRLVAGAAAGVVVLALVAAGAVGLTRGGGDDTPQPLVLGQATEGPVTTTGSQYTSADLGTQIDNLLAGKLAGPTSTSTAASRNDAGSDTSAGAGAVPSPGSSADALTSDGIDPTTEQYLSSATVASAALAPVEALVNNAATRQACLDQLASVPGAKAVAIDVGTFDGRPAAVIVLPDENDPTKVAAWVVGPTCSAKDDPFPYRYERVTRP